MVAEHVGGREGEHPLRIRSAAARQDRDVAALREIREHPLHRIGDAGIVRTRDDRRERAVDVEGQ